jgi:hypothetical protein
MFTIGLIVLTHILPYKRLCADDDSLFTSRWRLEATDMCLCNIAYIYPAMAWEGMETSSALAFDYSIIPSYIGGIEAV